MKKMRDSESSQAPTASEDPEAYSDWLSGQIFDLVGA
jgi:hypothetical protein